MVNLDLTNQDCVIFNVVKLIYIGLSK